MKVVAICGAAIFMCDGVRNVCKTSHKESMTETWNTVAVEEIVHRPETAVISVPDEETEKELPVYFK